jgi:glycogen debranching enzyme
MSDKTDAARNILARNDRGGYTVPTDALYPFQWNWDSAFVSMGFATFNIDRAYQELERLIEGQWDDGMIPHIVFHVPSDTYFPGPDVWNTDQRHHKKPTTSGITQPPIFGTALRYIYEIALATGQDNVHARTRLLFDAALRSHRWWLEARDPDKRGLVAILHPWESGSDNSPVWDEALARIPTTTKTEIRRQDTKHVNATMRPSNVDYQRFIHLVEIYRECGWDPIKQWSTAPFKVADVQMTAILARATADLIWIASKLNLLDEVHELSTMHRRLIDGLQGRWRDNLPGFVSLDLISGKDIEKQTQACFIPLIALELDPRQRKTVRDEIERWCNGMVIGVPSTAPFSSDFESKRYWRGPVWAIINWLIADGLRKNQLTELAAIIEGNTINVIEQAGFCEYFDPITGEGLGGNTFSWTAATYLVLRHRLAIN